MKNEVGVFLTLSLAEALGEERLFNTTFIPSGFGMIPLAWDQILLQGIGQLVDHAPNVFLVCVWVPILLGWLDGRKETTNKGLYDELTPKRTMPPSNLRISGRDVTADIDSSAFLASTYVAPEDRQAHPEAQQLSPQVEKSSTRSFKEEKALHYACFTASGLEYRWHSRPADDPFVDLPGTNSSS
ncbi:hypothetical protein BDW72DRAFT_185516 [Aspergillus terricola var. indicus]